MTIDNNGQHDRSSSYSYSSSSSAPAATVNLSATHRLPTGSSQSNHFIRPNILLQRQNHDVAIMSADGTASGTPMFCIEGYVNTPALSARRDDGLSQGLSANGPYKSLFRAGSRSMSRASASDHHKTNDATTAAAAPALHVLEALPPFRRLLPPEISLHLSLHLPLPCPYLGSHIKET